MQVLFLYINNVVLSYQVQRMQYFLYYIEIISNFLGQIYKK